MASKIEFNKRAHLVKDEVAFALENPELFAIKMNQAHMNGGTDKNKGNQIRLMGDISFVLKTIKDLGFDENNARIMKLEKNKGDRIGDYSSTHIRAYIKM